MGEKIYINNRAYKIMNFLIEVGYDKQLHVKVLLLWRDLVLRLSKFFNNEGWISIWRYKTGKYIKRFQEEAITICLYIEKNKDLYSKAKLASGSQNFDAELVKMDNSKIYIEVASVVDGHLDRKTMESLEKYGRAPLTLLNRDHLINPMNKNCEIFPEAVYVGAEVEEYMGIFKKVFNSKMENKNYQKNEYKYILLLNLSPTLDIDSYDNYINEIKKFVFTQRVPDIFLEIFVVLPWHKRIDKISNIH